MKTFNAVYPAYHPKFVAPCSNCKDECDSNILLITPDVPDEYICQHCASLYFYFDYIPVMCERDLKELKQYGSLYGD